MTVQCIKTERAKDEKMLLFHRDYRGLNLNNIWTLRRPFSTDFEHSDGVHEQTSDYIFSSYKGQVTDPSDDNSKRSIDCNDVRIPTGSPNQSRLRGAVSRQPYRGAIELERPRRACGVGSGGALPLSGGVAGVHEPRAHRRTGRIELAVSMR